MNGEVGNRRESEEVESAENGTFIVAYLQKRKEKTEKERARERERE